MLALLPIAAAGGQHALGLNAVGRAEVEIVHLGAEAVPVVDLIIDLAEEKVFVHLAGNELGPHARFQIIDGGGHCAAVARDGVGAAAASRGRVRSPPVGLPLRVEQSGADVGRNDRILTALQFAVEEIEQLVLLDRTADAEAGLMTPIRRIDSLRRGVGRIQSSVAEEPVGGAVNRIGAAASDGIDHAARGAPVLRKEIAGDDLEFLDGVLRDVIGARAAGVLVVKLVGGVDAVGEKRIAARIAAERQQAEGGVVGDAGLQQHERVHAAAVDGKVVDQVLPDHARNVGLGGFHDRRISRDTHLCTRRGNR